MMGSPFYYDVLFDDGPGDVVFHDCMWSGICTCCIQLLHQDSFYYANESPDLKNNCVSLATSCHPPVIVSPSSTTFNNNNNNNCGNNNQTSSSTSSQLINHNTCTSININSINTNNNSNSINTSLQDKAPHSSSSSSSSSLSSSGAGSTISPVSNINSSSSKSISPDTNLSSNSTSPDTNSSSSNSTSPDIASSLSNSTSPKPIRRREHNDSERKRRDHLRNAFNNLRDQVPRFKAINKKPPRIQILHEATLYVQSIMKESEELERRLGEEKAKHERLQNL